MPIKKKTRRKRKPKVYMMVIRVAVPACYVDDMKVAQVIGATKDFRVRHDLEILNAYMDRPGQPNARG